MSTGSDSSYRNRPATGCVRVMHAPLYSRMCLCCAQCQLLYSRLTLLRAILLQLFKA